MQTLILTLHLIVCFLLVVLILLQSGKEGMGVIFGGGNSSVFGSAGAGGILAKLTALMGIIFVITSLSYTYVTSSHTETESRILDVRIEDLPPPESAAPASNEQTAPVERAAPQNAASTQTPESSASPSVAPTPASENNSTPSEARETTKPGESAPTTESPKPASEAN